DDPPRWLAPLATTSPTGRPKLKAELPSEARVAGWVAALGASDDLLRLLRRERGLTTATVEEFGIGWDFAREGFTLPIRDAAGELVNVTWRAPKGRTLDLPGGARRSKHR